MNAFVNSLLISLNEATFKACIVLAFNIIAHNLLNDKYYHFIYMVDTRTAHKPHIVAHLIQQYYCLSLTRHQAAFPPYFYFGSTFRVLTAYVLPF